MIDEENRTEDTLEPSGTEPSGTEPSATAAATPPVDAVTGEPVAETGATPPSAEDAPTPDAAPATLDELDLSEGDLDLEVDGGGPGADEPATTAEGATEVPDAAAEGYQAAMADLMREVEALRAQVEDRTAQYLRLNADFENFRKRTQTEKEELDLRSRCDTLRELLTVVDNFERARSLIKPQTDSEMNIHKSYQGIYKQLVDALKRLGVAPMRPEGQPFDPNLHEAVMRQPSNDHPEDTVIEELQRGYVLGDRVLRHAMVKVAAPGEAVIASEEN
jgi:molecular chaperone GrpE